MPEKGTHESGLRRQRQLAEQVNGIFMQPPKDGCADCGSLFALSFDGRWMCQRCRLISAGEEVRTYNVRVEGRHVTEGLHS